MRGEQKVARPRDARIRLDQRLARTGARVDARGRAEQRGHLARLPLRAGEAREGPALALAEHGTGEPLDRLARGCVFGSSGLAKATSVVASALGDTMAGKPAAVGW